MGIRTITWMGDSPVYQDEATGRYLDLMPDGSYRYNDTLQPYNTAPVKPTFNTADASNPTWVRSMSTDEAGNPVTAYYQNAKTGAVGTPTAEDLKRYIPTEQEFFSAGGDVTPWGRPNNDGDFWGMLAPIAQIASFIPSPIQPFAQAVNAIIQSDQGNVLGAALPYAAPYVAEQVGGLFGPSSGDVMDAAIAQGAANAGTGVLGSVAQTFPIDMSTPQLLGDTATGAGGNMSWLDDLLNYTGDNAPLNTAVNTWDSLAQAPSSSSASINDLLGLTQGQGFSPAAGLGYTPASAITDALGATTGLEAALTGGAGAVAAANAPSWLSNLINQAAKDPLGTASNTLKAMGLLNAAGQPTASLTGMLGTAGNLAGGYLNTQAAKEAAQIQANAQIEAAKIAAEAAKFKPVGVTTRFGSSNFGYDDKGNLISAGYTLTPEMKAQQDALMATSGGLLNQFQGAQAATAPMGTAAQRAMQLGQGYLATDPAAQAQKYMVEQQALLAPTRERQMASTLQGEFNRGTYGLGTGSTSTGMMAANPRLEALMNAQRQQDLQLAANATQGGMDYAKFGAGMVGTGGDLLKSMYGTQTAAYSPYQTALGGATTIEGLGQNALTQGISLGGNVTAANAAAGGLLAQGMTNAANTVGSTAQQAGSTWGNLLQGAGNWMNKQAAPAAGQTTGMTPMYNPYTGQPIDWSK